MKLHKGKGLRHMEEQILPTVSEGDTDDIVRVLTNKAFFFLLSMCTEYETYHPSERTK